MNNKELKNLKTSTLRGEALTLYHSNRLSDIILGYFERLYTSVSRNKFLINLYSNEIDALIVQIETCPEEQVSVSDLAARIGISEHILENAFKSRRNCTISLFIQQQRLRLAKHLLLTTMQTIVAIAMTVGYADQSYFSKIFKRETGTTPGNYRKKLYAAGVKS